MCVCVSVSFRKYYLDTRTRSACIKLSIISEVRAASPFVSCPTGRQKRTCNPTPSASSQHLPGARAQFQRPVHALCHLPHPWRPAEPQPGLPALCSGTVPAVQSRSSWPAPGSRCSELQPFPDTNRKLKWQAGGWISKNTYFPPPYFCSQGNT